MTYIFMSFCVSHWEKWFNAYPFYQKNKIKVLGRGGFKLTDAVPTVAMVHKVFDIEHAIQICEKGKEVYEHLDFLQKWWYTYFNQFL